MVILLMFLYSDQCGGFCVCNIMSRMSGHVYPQSFMILNVFTIMFDLVHMQSQSFQMIFQSLMTSYPSVIFFFSAKSKCFGRHRKSYPLIPGWDLRGGLSNPFLVKIGLGIQWR